MEVTFPKFERANVRSFGFIKDLHQAISIADIALVPITSGGGTKLKIFDYMNAGLPIITTRKALRDNVKDKEQVLMRIALTKSYMLSAVLFEINSSAKGLA